MFPRAFFPKAYFAQRYFPGVPIHKPVFGSGIDDGGEWAVAVWKRKEERERWKRQEEETILLLMG